MGKKDKYSHLSKRQHTTGGNEAVHLPSDTKSTSSQSLHNTPTIHNQTKKHKVITRKQSIPNIDTMPNTSHNILQYLLGNTISVDTFFTDYWEIKPLHIQRHNTEFYNTLYNKAKFDQWLNEHSDEIEYGVNLNVFKYDSTTGKKLDLNPVAPRNDSESINSADSDSAADVSDSESVDSDSSDSNHYDTVTAEFVQNLYNSEHASIQHIQPQQYNNAKLYQLITLLESSFHNLVGCNAYITPSGAVQGLAPHHDDIEAFVLQCEGTKTWTLYTPNEQQQLAYTHSGDLDESTLGKPVMTVTLQTGDMLYMPRGTIHKAVTGNEHSVHLTLSTYQQYTYYDLLKYTLNNALIHARDNNMEFRTGLPVGFERFMGTGYQLMTDIAEQTQIGDETLLIEQAEKQQIVQDKFESLLTTLSEYIDLHAAADDLCDDYIQSRLPPYNTQTVDAINNNTVDSEATRTYGIAPTNEQQLIKLVDRDSIRITVGNIDEHNIQPNIDNEKQYVYVSFSTQNTVHTHMSNIPHTSLKRIALPLEVSPALITLYTTNTKYIKISDLPLPEQCELSNVQLGMTLWSVGMIDCKNA